jgi:hypothetical protein
MIKPSPSNIQMECGTIETAICLRYRNKHCGSSPNVGWVKKNCKNVNMGCK